MRAENDASSSGSMRCRPSGGRRDRRPGLGLRAVRARVELWTLVAPVVSGVPARRPDREEAPRCSALSPPEADFTAVEAEELARWVEHRVFERSVELRRGLSPGSSTRARRPPTVVPASTTCGPASTRTCSAGTGPCGAMPCPAKRDGTPTGCPSRSRWKSSWASRTSARSRNRSASPSSPACAGRRCGTTSMSGRTSPRAHRVLDRHRRRLLDLLDRVRRGGVVQPEGPLGRRPALRGHQGGPVLPAVWHRAVQPRAGPARRLPRRGRRVGLRPVPARRRGHRPGRAPADGPGPEHAGGPVAGGLDHDAVDPAVQHRGRGGPELAYARGRRLRGGGGPGARGVR